MASFFSVVSLPTFVVTCAGVGDKYIYPFRTLVDLYSRFFNASFEIIWICVNLFLLSKVCRKSIWNIILLPIVDLYSSSLMPRKNFNSHKHLHFRSSTSRLLTSKSFFSRSFLLWQEINTPTIQSRKFIRRQIIPIDFSLRNSSSR